MTTKPNVPEGDQFQGWNAYGQEATVVNTDDGQMIQMEGSAWWELVEAGTFKSEEELRS